MKPEARGFPSAARAALAGALALGSLSGAVADEVCWKGEDGAYLNDAANWDGAAPFSGVSGNDMKFKDVPSRDYTVRLSDDLVCAGCWSFSALPVRMRWDLGGHTLTFQTRYNSHCHQNWTNVFENGTVAYTNSAGALLPVTFWHQNGGTALRFGPGSSFIGNFKFQDSGTKTLEVADGATWRGNMVIPGIRSRATVSGAGTSVDLDGGTLSVGGNGEEALMEILDGASVTNFTYLYVGANERCEGDGTRLVVSNATIRTAAGKNFWVGGDNVNNGIAYASHRNEARFVGGASVNVTNVSPVVGKWSSHSNLLLVADAGTSFAAVRTGSDASDFPLAVGQNGCWNELRVTDGAALYGGSVAAAGNIKYQYTEAGMTSLWNRVTVERGASLDLQSELRAAYRHPDTVASGAAAKSLMASNVVEVLSGGRVRATGVMVGTLPCSRDNRCRVVGEGSRLDLYGKGNVTVGMSGASGNGLEVTGGAALTGVDTVKIGQDLYNDAYETTVGALASNNYVRIEKTTVEGVNTVEIGRYSNGGNALWVGDGAVVKAGGVIFRGFGQRLVVSNGTLRVACDGQSVQHGLRPAWDGGNYTKDDSGRHRFDFYGQGRILNGKSIGCDFTNACRFAFHVPANGYAEAPLESAGGEMRFSDDSEFAFDFSAVGDGALRNVPILAYSGGNDEAHRLAMSDALVAKAGAAAAAARPRSRVTLSSDRRTLTLRVASTCGTTIIVR